MGGISWLSTREIPKKYLAISPSIALESRRSFLGVLLGLGSFFVGALLSVPLIRFALFPLLRRTTELKESSVGALTDFSSLAEPLMRTLQIEHMDGWRKSVSEKVIYVTKDIPGQLLVLTSICPHLGCTVPWNKEKNQFVCPCHGATFFRRWNARQRALAARDGCAESRSRMANCWLVSNIFGNWSRTRKSLEKLKVNRNS